MTEDRHPDEDLLLDLVLGRASAQRSHQVIRHLGACGPCRTAYEELATAMESTLAAVPEATAPEGFESRVLARLHPAAAPAPVERPARFSRSARVPLAVAILLLGIAVGGVGVSAYERGLGSEPGATAPVEGSTELVTAGGETVGWAATGYGADGPVVVLAVEDASAGATLACRGVFDDRSTKILAEWTVYGDQPNLWILDAGDESMTAVELVDESGRVWAQARW